MLRKLLIRSGILLGLVIVLLGGYVGAVSAKYGGSMAKVYDIPLPALERSTDSLVIERGRHLAETVASCAAADCHGADLGGGATIEAGPVGTFTAPNITSTGLGGTYSDGELARLILHGVRRDGTSVRFMPSNELSWLPDEDVTAIISYVRSMPPVEKPNGPLEIGILGKVLDRHDLFALDVARRIDHVNRPTVPAPAPTAAYGEFLAKTCVGCHRCTCRRSRPHRPSPTTVGAPAGRPRPPGPSSSRPMSWGRGWPGGRIARRSPSCSEPRSPSVRASRRRTGRHGGRSC